MRAFNSAGTARYSDHIIFANRYLPRRQREINLKPLVLILIIAHRFGNSSAKLLIMHINCGVAVGMVNINDIATAAKLHPHARYIPIDSGMYRVAALLVGTEIK